MSLLDLFFPPKPLVLKPSVVHQIRDEEEDLEDKEAKKDRKRISNSERCKLYRQMKPEKAKQANKNWRAKHPEKQRELSRKWRMQNREKINAYRREKRAEKKLLRTSQVLPGHNSQQTRC